MYQICYPNGVLRVTVPAAESIAVFVNGSSQATIYRQVGFPNHPPALTILGVVQDQQTVFGAFAGGATIVISAGADPVWFEVGVAPVVKAVMDQIQPTPGVLNATGALTAAMMLTGIVTSTTGAAVAGTVPTGAVLDLAADWSVDEAFDWSVINTGGNTFTVTAATGHTLVGVAAVVTVTTGRFRTRKTAADTFVTYRIA